MSNVISLPILLVLLSTSVIIEQGWTIRIKNRMLSRYVATTYFRHQIIPSISELQNRFDIHSTDISAITLLPSQTIWKVRKKTINHHYYLGRTP